MPNPSQDDDIIELTEIVEQGTVDLSDDDAADFPDQPGEEHFEKEMGDLFAGSDADDTDDDEPLLLDDELEPLDDDAGDDTVMDSAFSDFISADQPSQDDLNASLNQSFGLFDETEDFADEPAEVPGDMADMEAEDLLDPTGGDAFDQAFDLRDDDDLAESLEDAEDVVDADVGLELFDPDDPDATQVLDDIELFDPADLEPAGEEPGGEDISMDFAASEDDDLDESFADFDSGADSQEPAEDAEEDQDLGPAWANGLNETEGLDDLDDLDSLLAEVSDSTVPLASEDDDLESPAEAVEGARHSPYVKALGKLSRDGGLDAIDLDLSPEEDLEDDIDIFEDLEAAPRSAYAEPEPAEEVEDVFSDLDDLMDGLNVSASESDGADEPPAEEQAAASPEDLADDLADESADQWAEEISADLFDDLPAEQPDLSPLLEVSEDRSDTLDDETTFEDLEILVKSDDAPQDQQVDEIDLADLADEADETDQVEAADLVEPWNEESEEDLLEDLAQANQAAEAAELQAPAQEEETPPDLNDLLASLDDEEQAAEPKAPATASDLSLAASVASFQGEMARRLETLESRLAAWRMDEVYRRLDTLEQGMAETRPEALEVRVNASVADALETAPEDSPLIQRLARTIVEGLEARLSAMLDARLKSVLPKGDLLTKEHVRELSESLRAELGQEMEQLAVQSAAKAIREELAGILTEAAGGE